MATIFSIVSIMTGLENHNLTGWKGEPGGGVGGARIFCYEIFRSKSFRGEVFFLSPNITFGESFPYYEGFPWQYFVQKLQYRKETTSQLTLFCSGELLPTIYPFPIKKIGHDQGYFSQSKFMEHP